MCIKAIKAGNHNTWPTITPAAVRCHFPESDETQQGHMKKQCQGVQSTRIQDEKENKVPASPKMNDIYIYTIIVRNNAYRPKWTFPSNIKRRK